MIPRFLQLDWPVPSDSDSCSVVPVKQMDNGLYSSVPTLQQHPSALPETRSASSETLVPTDRCDGMSVEGLNANCCFDDIQAADGFETDESYYFVEGKDEFGLERPSDSKALTNSERTLEKWEYLLRTRPRDPM